VTAALIVAVVGMIRSQSSRWRRWQRCSSRLVGVQIYLGASIVWNGARIRGSITRSSVTPAIHLAKVTSLHVVPEPRCWRSRSLAALTARSLAGRIDPYGTLNRLPRCGRPRWRHE